jgi:hypothetical protein
MGRGNFVVAHAFGVEGLEAGKLSPPLLPKPYRSVLWHYGACQDDRTIIPAD